MKSAVFFVALASAAVLAHADEPRPVGDAERAERSAQLVVVVPPSYPAAAQREGITATVDVHGTIRTNGSLLVQRMEAVPDRDDFRAAVADVARFWIMRPYYDDRCKAKEVEGTLRVWFDLKDGKPSISVSVPPPKPVTRINPPTDALYGVVLRIDPDYPRAALRLRREGAVEALLRVSDSGDVEEVVIVPGADSAVFGPEVVSSLSQWKFVAAARPVHCVLYSVFFKIK